MSVEEPAKQSTNSVVLKVGMVGDSQIGKTSLMVKYVEGSFDEDYIQTLGVNFMEKTISIRNTEITFSIWDLGGQREFVNMLPLVCNDAMAILFMFDLSRKSTLNSIKEWYRQARGFNKIAIPFLIGTKYDHFATFPNEEKEEITKQARRFASVMKAPLIFCSTSHSINVQKIFKIVLSKVFDLKCTIPEIVEKVEQQPPPSHSQPQTSAATALLGSQQQQEAPVSGVLASGLKASLFAHIYDDRVDILNTNGTNSFDPDKCKFYRGCLICVFQDHRTNPNPNLTGKWAALRPNSNTLWGDILRMNQAAGGVWTNQTAIELESKLLLAIHPKPDLDSKSTLPGLTPLSVKNDKELPLFIHRDKPKKRKRLLNSLEIELERKNKAELVHLMKTMHPRNRKKFKQDLTQETIFKKNKERKISIPADSNGKQKLLMAQSSQVMDQSRTQRTLMKRMRWEEILTTSDDQKTKCHTILVVYLNFNAKYDMFIYKIKETDFHNFSELQRFIHEIDEDKTVLELKDSRAELTYSFDTEDKWKDFIKQFTVLYGFKNELKFVWSLNEEEEKSLAEALKQIANNIGEITTPEQVPNKDARQLIDKYFSEEPPDHLPQPVYQFTYKDKKQMIALETVQDFINASDVNKKMMDIKKRGPPAVPLISANDTATSFSSGHIRKPPVPNNPISNPPYTQIPTEPGLSMPSTSLNQAATSIIPNTPINQPLVPPVTNTPINQIPIPNMSMNHINPIPNLPMNRVSMPVSNNIPVSVGAISNTTLNQMATPSLPVGAVQQVATPILATQQQIRQVMPGVPMGQYQRISMSPAQLQQLQQRPGMLLPNGNVQQLLLNRGMMVGNPSQINSARMPVSQAAGINTNNVLNSAAGRVLIDGNVFAREQALAIQQQQQQQLRREHFDQVVKKRVR
ncbi:12383_t:CDS:10 [Ambispora gerdemannii]|uniref:12383_t:CDS:1 n=1 Tax=Ambispora gerdemannii TaxID=144530 RepID=A0A9N8V1J5_9GLOM|nr:12383_t:CDS:10 [Ambispora gerdemannii]